MHIRQQEKERKDEPAKKSRRLISWSAFRNGIKFARLSW